MKVCLLDVDGRWELQLLTPSVGQQLRRVRYATFLASTRPPRCTSRRSLRHGAPCGHELVDGTPIWTVDGDSGPIEVARTAAATGSVPSISNTRTTARVPRSTTGPTTHRPTRFRMPKPIRKLADLTPDPHNARTHSAANLDLIDASLDAVGAGRSIVISKTGRILAGNATVSRALAKGLKVKVVDGARDTIIAVRRSDLSEQDETTLALYDNRAAELAAWNPEVLQSLQRDGHDLGAMWPAEDLAKLLAEDAAPSTRDVDEVPPVRASTRIKAGDLFALGGSRLLCADCRADGAIAHALGADTRAQVVFTSPPYASQRKYDTSSGFTPIHPDDYVDWFNDVQRACWAALADDGSYFLNIKEHTDAGQRHLYVKDLTIAHVRRWGWRWVDEFCWRDTKNGVPGIWPNRFKDAWEPVFHFTKQAKIKFRPLANAKASDAAFSYQPSIKASSTGSGLLGAGGRPISASGLARPSNVIEIAASSTGGHSAAFPVALPRWFIDAFTDAGDWVLEPFSGSGTTLVAATQADRRCAAVEISAAYVQVAIDRWELLTGQKAERLERGR